MATKEFTTKCPNCGHPIDLPRSSMQERGMNYGTADCSSCMAFMETRIVDEDGKHDVNGSVMELHVIPDPPGTIIIDCDNFRDFYQAVNTADISQHIKTQIMDAMLMSIKKRGGDPKTWTEFNAKILPMGSLQGRTVEPAADPLKQSMPMFFGEIPQA